MTAKMKSKRFRPQTRPDWDQIRVKIMRWCLRVKLLQHRRRFGELLRATGEKPIVEESIRDQFWGAKPGDDGILRGQNVLGRLLMELREDTLLTDQTIKQLEPPAIPNLVLLGRPVGAVGDHEIAEPTPVDHPESATPELFETSHPRPSKSDLLDRSVRILGELAYADWVDLLNHLASSGLDAETVSVDVTLHFRHEATLRLESADQLLSQIQRRFGLRSRPQ
jgi:hypothetical protein